MQEIFRHHLPSLVVSASLASSLIASDFIQPSYDAIPTSLVSATSERILPVLATVPCIGARQRLLVNAVGMS
jgi:hypothetical protein